MSVHRTDQIDNRLVAGNVCRVHRVGGKKVSIAGAQGVSFMTDAQFQFAADDPVRLIFSVRVWSILGSGRVAPLKNTVAFALQLLLQNTGVRVA